MKFTQLITKFKKVAKLWSEFEKKPHNLEGQLVYRSEIFMLINISNNPQSSITGLAKITGMTKGTVSEVVKKLKKRGFVNKIQSVDNASKSSISLTNAGQEILKYHKIFHKKLGYNFKEYYESLTEPQLQMIEEFFTEAENFFTALKKYES